MTTQQDSVDVERLQGRFWLIVHESGMVPERKGSWPVTDTAKVLREFIAARPAAYLHVLTIGPDRVPDVNHGPEVLQMLDGRSMSVGRKHNARTLAAHTAALSLPITQRDEQGDQAPTSDSSVYKHTFYGILNAQGDFWTPLAFESEKAATDHIIRFWGGAHTEKAKQCLSTHTIVPVRINLTAIRRLSIEQGDQDGGAG